MSAREPVQILGLRQPRCGLRYGVAPCTASCTPKCYQTLTTCPVPDIYDPTGSIEWRFVKDTPGDTGFGDFSDPDNIKTNGIGGLVSVSSAKSTMNVGGVLDGKSPFGTLGGISAEIKNTAWDDYVGDFYHDERTQPERTFWPVWNARNEFYGEMYLVAYDGYAGQDLSEMRQRIAVLDSVDGPNSSGRVTLKGSNPLRLAGQNKGEFPRTTPITLAHAIRETQTNIIVFGSEDDVTDAAEFGTVSYLVARIGDEVIRYSGATLLGSGAYRLDGVVRGFDNTTPQQADEGDAMQRCGRFDEIEPWRIGKYLMQRTRIPAEFFDFDQWEEEGDLYLSIFKRSITIAEVNVIEDLMGEVCQQGMFNIWWNEDAQKIPMLAVRPARGTIEQLTYQSNFVAGSTALRSEPKSLMTRGFVYYGPRSPVASRTDPANYQKLSGEIESATERAAGGKFARSIFARFVETEAHAFQLITRLFMRYGKIPRFLSVYVTDKDKHIQVGEVVDAISQQVVDLEGNVDSARWQVIATDEVKVGEVYLLDLQSFNLLGRYGYWMADGSPDYDAATDEERALGAWWADDDGKMGDGSDGYRWQ